MAVNTRRLGISSAAAAATSTPAINPRSTWGADLPPKGPMSSELPGDVRFLLVHHTAGPNGYRPEAVRSTLRAVYAHHTGPKGWNDVAYNFLVDAYGGIWEGRLGSQAGPVKGDATGGSQGYAQLCCFIGDHQRTPPTAAALSAMAHLLAWLAVRYGVDLRPGATATFVSRGSSLHPPGTSVTTPTITGHRDMSTTTCPGDAAYPLVRGQLTQTAAVLAGAMAPPLREVFAFGSAPDLGSTAGQPLGSALVGMAPVPAGNGYWLVGADGGIFSYGAARFFGSAGGVRLQQPVVGMAATPTGNGYWLVAFDGGVFAYGDAPFLGSTGGIRLHQPVVGMAATPSGGGYWLVASDGGIFAFGDAPFLGSTGGIRLDRPVVGMAATPSGNGYWLVASDGGIFAFGDARFLGSTGGVPLASPVVGMGPVVAGDGYRLVAGDGGVFSFGAAPFLGRPDPAALRSGRAVAMARHPGGGYWVAATR